MTPLIKLLLPLASPIGLTLLGLAAASGLLLKGKGRWRLLGKLLVPASLLVLFLSSLPVFAVPALRRLEYQYPSIEASELRKAGVDTIVVLGGGVTPVKGRPTTSNLSNPSLTRLIEGIRLYTQIAEKNQHHPTLILSGRGKYETEASQMALLARDLGVPSEDIELEESSMNTADQARLLKERLGGMPFALVTSASHMPRSMRAFQQMGLNPIAAPTDHCTEPLASKHSISILLSLPHSNNIKHMERVLYESLARVRTDFEVRRALKKEAEKKVEEKTRK